jgi:hypothetical protein
MAKPPQSAPEPELLRLRAADIEDLSIIASCLQDAILPVSEMAYAATEQRFVAVANRFRWERLSDGDGFERIRSALSFAKVRRCQLRHIDLRDRAFLLNLLTIDVQALEAGGFAVTLLCAEDRAIRLEVDDIDMLMGDYGIPWTTSAAPRHQDDEPSP